jgi:peroxiredoxin
MNIYKLSLIILFAAVSSISASVETGTTAPNFTLTDTTGVTHSLSDFKGKYVVLEWTNHKCPFVVKHYTKGDMQATQKAMADEGAIWLQIVSSAPGKQGHVTAAAGEALRKELAMNSTAMLLDESGEVGKAYDARKTPQMYLINPEGVLIYQGAIDSNPSTRQSDIADATNYVVAAYTSAKAGEPVKNATTSAYGCGIKY